MGRRRKLEHIYNTQESDNQNQDNKKDLNNLNQNVNENINSVQTEKKISHLNLDECKKKNEKEILEEKPKKKRGRKPRYMTNGEPQPPKEKVMKKRGRRPKEKYNFNTEPLVVTDHINESENIIVKLPVKTSDLNQNEFMNNLYSYNPQLKEPEPYDPNQDFNITEKNQMNFSEYKKSPTNRDLIKKKKKSDNYDTIKEERVEENKKPKRQIDLLLHNKYNKEKKIKLLTELSNNNSECSYPNKTNISCFWCSHEFQNQPWGIPLSYTDKKFNLFGVFCSPQCACSYLFNSEEFAEKKWESYSLLNLLYKEVYGEFIKILPAPSKLCLIKFGGKIPIEKYREELLQGNNIYLVKFPPVSSIIPVMEEVNLKKIQLKNNFIPVDKDRILKANQELRLKRSKPVNNKNTLDNCINILK